MKFRPCIDIHDGKVKQIVGSTLNDSGAIENFVANKTADEFAMLYKENELIGGHIILLNKKGTPEYEETRKQAMLALQTFPGGMQVGGGIDSENAMEFIEAGASHVIVTSYVFKNGEISIENLNKLVNAVGKERIVLDLSCKKIGEDYFIATDRWQKITNVKVDEESLNFLADFCDEFLIHAVDVEGKQNGIEQELVKRLSTFDKRPITYAGGVKNLDDLQVLKELGKGQIDVTIGSALDLFGGKISFYDVVSFCDK